MDMGRRIKVVRRVEMIAYLHRGSHQDMCHDCEHYDNEANDYYYEMCLSPDALDVDEDGYLITCPITGKLVDKSDG